MHAAGLSRLPPRQGGRPTYAHLPRGGRSPDGGSGSARGGGWRPDALPPPGRLLRAATAELAPQRVEPRARTARAPQRAIETVVRPRSGAMALAGMGRSPRGPFDGPT